MTLTILLSPSQKPSPCDPALSLSPSPPPHPTPTLHETQVRADGGLGSIICDVAGLPPDPRLWGADGLQRGTDSVAKTGHYMATAMLAQSAANSSSHLST